MPVVRCPGDIPTSTPATGRRFGVRSVPFRVLERFLPHLLCFTSMAPAVPMPMRRPHPNRPPSLAQAAPAAEAADAPQAAEAAAEEEPPWNRGLCG